MNRLVYLLLCCALLPLGSCQQAVSELRPTVLNVYPHDPEAFTQGLLLENGRLYESTGLNGRSSLREVDLETGEVIRILPLSDEYFGEGLAEVDGDLIQITWQSGEAFRYDLETFNLLETYHYDTEGWGLCYDGETLYMSDGTATLVERDPETFERLNETRVTLNGEPLSNLNELECVGNYVYANVWQSDRIVKIDKRTGRVSAAVDASALSAESGRSADPNAVLNGVAYNPDTETFYVTGKFWPTLFEVEFTKP